MAVTLYKRQRQIVDFLAQYIQKNGYSPTLKEIAGSINVSSLATVHEHLQTLERKKVIKKHEGAVRGIELIDRTFMRMSESIDLPWLGYIAAGSPIEPHPDQDASFKVSPEMISGKKRAYVLQVRGQSMIEDHIDDGDYVVVEEVPEPDVKDGDIVVALLDTGLATLKRFYREMTRIRLEPANSTMSPIYATNVQIQGRVVGLIRKFRYY
jgi:repressor LexA